MPRHPPDLLIVQRPPHRLQRQLDLAVMVKHFPILYAAELHLMWLIRQEEPQELPSVIYTYRKKCFSPHATPCVADLTVATTLPNQNSVVAITKAPRASEELSVVRSPPVSARIQ
jgi:hypothetical protein